MKAYGHSRRDKLECGYGCCTTKSGPMKDCRKVNDRGHRKSARQAAKVAASEWLEPDTPTDPTSTQPEAST